jgi:tetratricopeptide (TPR) repeat protein
LQVLAGLLALEALSGIVQVWGPATLPGSFAAQEAMILSAYPEGDAMREGLLHAVRSGRASGTVGAPNIFATFAAAGALLNGGLALWQRPRLPFAAASALCLYAVLLSQSRGGLLALLGGVVLLGAMEAARRMEPRRAAQLLLGAVGFLLLGGIALACVLFFVDAHHSRWLGVGGLLIRVAYWKTAMAMAADAPLQGRGLGAFEALYILYRQPGADETRHAHSWLFEALAGTGVVGVLLLAGALLVTMALAVAALMGGRRGEAPRGIAVLAAAFAALVAHGLLEYTFSFRESFLLIGMIGGFLLALLASHRSLEVPGRILSTVGLLTGLLVLPLLLSMQGAIARGEAARDEATAILVEGGDLVAARAVASRAIEADPRDARNWELRAIIDDQLGSSTFESDMAMARRLNPHSARLIQTLAEHHARRSQWPEAIRLQREAVAVHPLSLNLRLRLGEMLLAAGDREAARAVYIEALPVKAFRDLENERRAALAVSLEVVAETGLPFVQAPTEAP